MLHIILHVVLDVVFLSKRQWGCFFLNSEQNSVLECNLLLKLDLLTIHSNEKCLHVCYIYIYMKGSGRGAKGSFELEAGLDNLLKSLPAWIFLWSIWGSLQILVPQGDNELMIHFCIKVWFKSSMKWVHWS